MARNVSNNSETPWNVWLLAALAALVANLVVTQVLKRNFGVEENLSQSIGFFVMMLFFYPIGNPKWRRGRGLLRHVLVALAAASVVFLLQPLIDRTF